MKCQIKPTIELLMKIGVHSPLTDKSQFFVEVEKSDISDEIKTLIMTQNSESLLEKLALTSLIKCNIIHTPDEEDDENEDEDEKQISQLVNQ